MHANCVHCIPVIRKQFKFVQPSVGLRKDFRLVIFVEFSTRHFLRGLSPSLQFMTPFVILIFNDVVIKKTRFLCGTTTAGRLIVDAFFSIIMFRSSEF